MACHTLKVSWRACLFVDGAPCLVDMMLVVCDILRSLACCYSRLDWSAQVFCDYNVIDDGLQQTGIFGINPMVCSQTLTYLQC